MIQATGIMGKKWVKQMKKQIEGYTFDVGVLADRPHFQGVEPKRGQPPDLKSYAGGPARKVSRVLSDKSTGEVLIANMQRLNINILLRPFQETNATIIKFTSSYLRFACKAPGASIKRCENLIQAIVRNPILKQEYGHNSGLTADSKGFSRALIDTAQMFKSIIAKAIKRA